MIRLNTALVLLPISIACAAGTASDRTPASESTDASTTASASREEIEVWIVLSEPALSSLPRDAESQRAELRRRILEEQDRVMRRLAELGAVESARTQQTRNAIAVTLPAAAIESVKKIDGVTAVKTVSHRNRVGR
ncbi:hypothetical protein HNQ60_002648 [Povalibacter uvarum]|uniref:Uncharacterized protein n=1 Tax=Povalibacter uvarum TaxID=732238 RepID=A0A841HL28_9GAMM|nr:hypothetical protein [Povalibacter uvarum]MBB6093767.1 hypothetical protein [Povalibacter uvarum]